MGRGREAMHQNMTTWCIQTGLPLSRGQPRVSRDERSILPSYIEYQQGDLSVVTACFAVSHTECLVHWQSDPKGGIAPVD